MRQESLNRRNYGVDALRLFSMFLITILHVLGQGGILSVSTGGAFYANWMLETLAMCSVNCFGVISGYVGYTEEEKPYRFYRYVSTWLQVVFYSFGIRLLYFAFSPELMEGKSLLEALLPVSTYHYWYVSAYTGLFFLIPWLNHLIRRISKEEVQNLAIVLFAVFSFYGNFARVFSDVFRLGGGYSFGWLVILYIFGAWMKKCSIPQQLSSKFCFSAVILCVIISWIPTVFFPSIRTMFLTYLSPTMVLMAVFLFVIFSKIEFGSVEQKMIKMFAPAAFGVYLLHVQQDIWTFFMKGRFVFVAQAPNFLVPVGVLISAASVFLFCLMVEKGRLILFEKLHLNQYAEQAVQFVCGKVICFLNPMCKEQEAEE